MDFFRWLITTRHSDADVQDLANHAQGDPRSWVGVASQGDAHSLIDRSGLQPQDKDRLKNGASVAWAEFRAAQRPRGNILVRLVDWVQDNAATAVIIALSILVFVIIVRALFTESFLEQLSDARVARGIITLFFALGTVGVALIVVSAAFTSEQHDIGQRFDMGKQVLATLIGVFGTIVGFYFGSELSEAPEQTDSRSQTEASALSEPAPEAEPPGAQDDGEGDPSALIPEGAFEPSALPEPARAPEAGPPGAQADGESDPSALTPEGASEPSALPEPAPAPEAGPPGAQADGESDPLTPERASGPSAAPILEPGAASRD